MYWSLEYVDERIGTLLATLEEEGMADFTDIFVVSDYDFMNYDRIFVLNECFKRQGWFGDSIKDSKVFAISQGGSCFVYVNETGNARMESLKEVREVLNGHEAIEAIYDKDQHPIARIISADWTHADGQALDHIWREEVRSEFKLHAEAKRS